MRLRRVARAALRLLPPRVAAPIRNFGNAILTPIYFSILTGHFRSCVGALPVASDGSPLPWYPYPLIAFLEGKDFSACRVFEAGGGHSTLWWAMRAKDVVTLEGNPEWLAKIQGQAPPNVRMFGVPPCPDDRCLATAKDILATEGKFDVVVIDGLCRRPLLETLLGHLRDDGAVICDDVDVPRHQFAEAFAALKLSRVDFCGYGPGSPEPRRAAIVFRERCFLFAP